MRSVIASPKFQNAEMELPIAFGKTISNETFVVDLAKMPHLLMAGGYWTRKVCWFKCYFIIITLQEASSRSEICVSGPKKK